MTIIKKEKYCATCHATDPLTLKKCKKKGHKVIKITYEKKEK